MTHEMISQPGREIDNYDNPDPSSLARAAVRASAQATSLHRWRAPIEEVSLEERNRRILDDPMERIFELVSQYSPSEEGINRALILDYQKNGNLAARERIVNENLGFVIYLAKDGWKKVKAVNATTSLDFADLFQEGVIGLQEAVEKFDLQHSSKAKFSTYAAHIIRQRINRVIANCGSTIRIPVHMDTATNNTRREIEKLWIDSQKEPTPPEIIGTLTPPMPFELARAQYDDGFLIGDLSERRLGEIARIYKIAKEKLPRQELEEFIRITAIRRPISLDFITDTKDGDNDMLIDPLSEDEIDLTPARINRFDLLQTLREFLTDQEMCVIAMRYGLLDQEPRTIDQVGRALNITRERVRKIENQVLRRLKLIWIMRDFQEDTRDTGSAGNNTTKQAAMLENMRDTIYPHATTQAATTHWKYKISYRPSEADGTPRIGEQTDREILTYLSGQLQALIDFGQSGDISNIDPLLARELVITMLNMHDHESQLLEKNGHRKQFVTQLLREIKTLYAIIDKNESFLDGKSTPLHITRVIVARRYVQYKRRHVRTLITAHNARFNRK